MTTERNLDIKKTIPKIITIVFLKQYICVIIHFRVNFATYHDQDLRTVCGNDLKLEIILLWLQCELFTYHEHRECLSGLFSNAKKINIILFNEQKISLICLRLSCNVAEA